ncbi:RNA polymerase sigma factor [Roseimaritima multifibrata]|uniref:RNA polymerase sigma factor n=1 Tax=Roseimaritima multifibrata TaxID=1930274 RepID=A0A517MH71_9BACT|nr:RNA polymerase sigma factor [Roseimaritima multifibrata]
MIQEGSLAILPGSATAGDDRGREELIGMDRPWMRLVAGRYTRRIFKARYDQSDVVEVTLLEVCSSFPDFNGKTTQEITRWVEVILERTTLRMWREHVAKKRDVRRGLAMQACPSELSFLRPIPRDRVPSAQGMSGEQLLMVAQSSHSHPQRYRWAIELRFIAGLKLREIACQMETTIGVVAGSLRRGLEELNHTLPSGVRSNSGVHQ